MYGKALQPDRNLRLMLNRLSRVWQYPLLMNNLAAGHNGIALALLNC